MFKKAERKRAHLKLAITAPSGGGKTFSALLIAKGLGKKIAVIDTENDSASLYSDKFEFDSAPIDQPYTVKKYSDAIKAAEHARYDVLIIDSLSHAWAGEGGLLSKKEAMDTRGGNSFANWGAITKEHEVFKAAILNAKIHIICTMRSKQEYSQDKSESGKLTIKKVGLAPIQRDGMEYEFTTVFDLGMDHTASISKDRTGLFDGQFFMISEATGVMLKKWLDGAVEVKVETNNKPSEESKKDEPTKPAECEKVPDPEARTREKMIEAIKRRKWTNAGTRLVMEKFYKKTMISDLTIQEYDAVLQMIECYESATQAMAIDEGSFNEADMSRV